MPSAEGSFLGIARQTAKGTPNTTDADFKYLLFSEGSPSVQNVTRPLDVEVGGGALLRDVVKAGVTSGAGLNLIPRPETLGFFLNGLLGNVVTIDNADGSYEHTFTLGEDQFAAPYYTLRNAPGNLWGEQYRDVRVSQLALSWRGADFVRGQVGMIGGLPDPVSTAAWNALSQVDKGPQFLAPKGAIELPTGVSAKCLAGSFVAGAAIPLDEQWIVGSYVPDDFDIVSKTFVLQMSLKIADAALYQKMAYDPAGGAAWAADILREADINIEFASDKHAGTTPTPYSIKIAANGQSQASGNGNVAWSVAPVSMRAGRNLIMNVTGVFIASPTADEPITVTLVNKRASYA